MTRAFLFDPATEAAFLVPGAMQRVIGPNGGFWGFLLGCPGCGVATPVRIVGERDQHGWHVVHGTPDLPETLSLEPLLSCRCCGWAGLLKFGGFFIVDGPLLRGCDD